MSFLLSFANTQTYKLVMESLQLCNVLKYMPREPVITDL